MDNFDPYHRWLGIPPEEQPANHYRLLGLAAFEDDTEVIRDAAERQMAHVRRSGLGQYSALSQKILNELAAAKTCLLDPAKKSEYDAGLREKMARKPSAQPAAPAASGSPSGPAAPAASAPRPAQRVAGPRRPPRPSAAAILSDAPPRTRPWLFIGIGASVLAGAGMIGMFFLGSKSAPLVLQPLEPKSVQVGSEVTWQLSVENPSAWQDQVRYSLLASGAPAGAAIDPKTGLLTWKPSQPGPATLTVQAASVNDSQQTSVQSLTVEVAPAPVRPPSLAAVPDQTAKRGEPLNVAVNLKDRGTAPGPINYRLGPGAPPGARIDPATGVFSWTPGNGDNPGDYPITIVASDSQKQSAEVRFHVRLEAVNRAPSIQTAGEQRIRLGAPARVSIVAVDPDGPANHLTYSLLTMIDWIQIDSNSGVLTCSPRQEHVGTIQSMTVRVTDDGSPPLSDQKTITILVEPDTMASERTTTMPGTINIRFPSGATLSNQDVNIEAKGKLAAENLRQRCMKGETDVIYTPFVYPPQHIEAVCSAKGNAPSGEAVFFHRGKDPLTCYNNRLHSGNVDPPKNPSPTSLASSRVLSRPTSSSRYDSDARVSCWNEVVLKKWIVYDGGKWQKIASWDADGRKVFFGTYLKGRRNGLCCLFQQDRLKMVLECNRGDVSGVHLIFNEKIAKSFANADEAKADSAAVALLADIEKTESDLREDDKAFAREVAKAMQLRMGMINQIRRAAQAQRSADRERENNAVLNSLQRAAMGK